MFTAQDWVLFQYIYDFIHLASITMCRIMPKLTSQEAQLQDKLVAI